MAANMPVRRSDDNKPSPLVSALKAEKVSQEGWTHKYTQKEDGSYASASGLPVDPTQNFKSKAIHLASFARPHMRAFHFSWMSFFLAFLCWFAFAPLMPTIRAELGLNMKQVLTVNMCSVACTIFARFLLGPLCEEIGPKRLQTYLLLWISVMCFLAPTVNSFAGLLFLRMAIGIGGGAFVVTQFWSSQMFTPEIVGLANATTGGWGNLGGGVTQMFMSFLFEGFLSAGASPSSAWRCAMLVPAIIVLLFAILMRTSSDDCPQGDLLPLMKAGVIEKKDAKSVARAAFFNPNAWLLGLQYAACFGVELHMCNLAAMYFFTNFGVSQFTAGNLASVFGFMNICCRSIGGDISDKMMKVSGMQGRLLAQTFGLMLEGISIVIFSKCTTIGSAMPVMVVFSACVQAVEGMTFGIVPYVDPANLGAVCGVVGAWGNIGAVTFSWLFREYFAGKLDEGFNVLGFIVIASSVATLFVKIPGHSSLLDSEPYTPATVLATEALARVAKLEEKLQMQWQPGAPLMSVRRSAEAIDQNGNVYYAPGKSTGLEALENGESITLEA